jgi:hypothetical protein
VGRLLRLRAAARAGNQTTRQVEASGLSVGSLQFDLEQDHTMNDDIPSRVLAIEGRGRFKVSYFLKRANLAEQPRELIDRVSMSVQNLAQPPRN